jgi:hypothetical protein
MRQIINVNLCDDLGEYGGMFEKVSSKEYVLIDIWSSNDANWRGEYFSGILSHFDIEEVTPTARERKKLEKLLHEKAEEYWG